MRSALFAVIALVVLESWPFVAGAVLLISQFVGRLLPAILQHLLSSSKIKGLQLIVLHSLLVPWLVQWLGRLLMVLVQMASELVVFHQCLFVKAA